MYSKPSVPLSRKCIRPFAKTSKSVKPLNYFVDSGIREATKILRCGTCIPCRRAKQDELVLRGTLELYGIQKAVSVTLTYRDEDLPQDGNLSKKHIRLFLMRLRKEILKRYNIKIRYLVAGEYGSKKSRPHYHAIIYGIGYDIKTYKPDIDQIRIIKEKWGKGDILDFQHVSNKSIRYTVKYILKSCDNNNIQWLWDMHKKTEPEFRIMSKGLGKKFCDALSEQRKKSPFYDKDIWIDELAMRINPESKSRKLILPRYMQERINENIGSSETAKANQTLKYEKKIGEVFTDQEEKKSIMVEHAIVNRDEYQKTETRYKNMYPAAHEKFQFMIGKKRRENKS